MGTLWRQRCHHTLRDRLPTKPLCYQLNTSSHSSHPLLYPCDVPLYELIRCTFTNSIPTPIPINACLCMYTYKNLRKLRETKSSSHDIQWAACCCSQNTISNFDKKTDLARTQTCSQSQRVCTFGRVAHAIPIPMRFECLASSKVVSAFPGVHSKMRAREQNVTLEL